MLRTNLWCYLWDLVDEGLDEACDQIQGNLGAAGVSVATSYHCVAQLRPRADVRPRLFHSQGGLCFQPERSQYEHISFNPVVASWLANENPLAEVSKRCQERKLALHGWTVCCHQEVLAVARPELACRNAFGDVDRTWLCPAHPDVRHYLCGLVADLSRNYAIDVIELESPHWPESRHVHEHKKVGPLLPPVAETLLAQCFCDACRSAAADAGVDAKAVQTRVADLLNTFLRTEKIGIRSLNELADRDTDAAAFFEWRFNTVKHLIADIKKACRSKLLVYGVQRSLATGYDPARILPHVDALMDFAYSPETSPLEAAGKALADLLPEQTDGWAIGLNATHFATPNAQALVRNATRAAELGFTQANIYNYGLLTDERFTWVRQAIRSARRVGNS